MLLTIFFITVPSIAVGNLFLYNGLSPTVYIIYMVSIFPLPVMFVLYKMRKVLITLKQIFLDIGSSCSMYSIEGVVTYQLHDEWWGGCSKPYSRRRFFVVNVSGAAGQDIEQQSGGNAVSYPVQTYDQANINPTAPTAPANGGTSGSLFNKLSSGI
jgi:hypothetical protein